LCSTPTIPPSPRSATICRAAALAELRIGHLPCRVVFYGLEDTRHSVGAVQHMADSQFCQRCGTAYVYDAVFYGHVGHYHCPKCGLQRPTPTVQLQRLTLDGTAGSILAVRDDTGVFDMRLPVPGLYNALNATAAAAVGYALQIPPATIRDALESFTAAFGRIERVTIEGRAALIALIKNPVGASETVRMITNDQKSAGDGSEVGASGLNLLIVINDKIADGTDVSWLWDADFEQLAGRVAHVIVSGTRAEDMAVRLKYAGVDADRIVAEPDLARALDRVAGLGDRDAPLYLLPTYTAMLELREELARRGVVKPFWED
jgi:lipid II isoglutaminyl synthase (glutamine-hydrolysing)